MNVSELDNAGQMQCQKLERLKMEAVSAEDYELAASLKKQIAALKTGAQQTKPKPKEAAPPKPLPNTHLYAASHNNHLEKGTIQPPPTS